MGFDHPSADYRRDIAAFVYLGGISRFCSKSSSVTPSWFPAYKGSLYQDSGNYLDPILPLLVPLSRNNRLYLLALNLLKSPFSEAFSYLEFSAPLSYKSS
jgi:hypothetical protein